MNRIYKILNNKSFRENLEKLKEYEADRIYCRHNMEHFLDVARIATILNEDEKLQYDREIIYAAALLHDLGRVAEYENKAPHDEASVWLAKEILAECDFIEDEIAVVTEAIGLHRRMKTASDDKSFAMLLYRADKFSRNCMMCDVPGCKIPLDKRNTVIV